MFFQRFYFSPGLRDKPCSSSKFFFPPATEQSFSFLMCSASFGLFTREGPLFGANTSVCFSSVPAAQLLRFSLQPNECWMWLRGFLVFNEPDRRGPAERGGTRRHRNVFHGIVDKELKRVKSVVISAPFPEVGMQLFCFLYQ